MTKEQEDLYNKEYNKLYEMTHEIRPWYDIDKVKPYSVYIWTKGENGGNVFDIHSDTLMFYDTYDEYGNVNLEHVVIEEAKPIIEKLQAQLRVIEGTYEK